ncbi:MAG: VOC family protein [Cyanobacteria bacterium J06626_18]
MKLGAINHIAICVSDLARSMSFYQPILRFLGYENSESFPGVEIWESHSTGTAINLWQAKEEHIESRHYDYAPGLHHLAFHATARKEVDDFYRLLSEIGAEIVNEPAEYDYAPGYYAVFFRDPDAIRIELAYIPTLSNAPVAG